MVFDVLAHSKINITYITWSAYGISISEYGFVFSASATILVELQWLMALNVPPKNTHHIVHIVIRHWLPTDRVK